MGNSDFRGDENTESRTVDIVGEDDNNDRCTSDYAGAVAESTESDAKGTETNVDDAEDNKESARNGTEGSPHNDMPMRNTPPDWSRRLQNKRKAMGQGSETGGEEEVDPFAKMQGSLLYRIFDTLCILVLMNLCMLLLTVCGLVVFGLFPAIMAGAEYFKDVLERNDGQMLSTMFRYFKKNFLVGNLLMLVTVPAIVLFFYLIIGPELNTVAYLLIFLWIIIALVLDWYLPSVQVLYPDFSVKKKFVFSLVAGLTKWPCTILFVAITVGWMYLVLLMPQLFGWVFLSAPTGFGMWLVRRALFLSKKGRGDKTESQNKTKERKR